MVPSPILPIEILEAIINNFDPSSSADRVSLNTCSYANHDFKILCQRSLFRQPTLHIRIKVVFKNTGLSIFWEDERQSGTKLLALLGASSHLGQYIRAIGVFGKRTPDLPYNTTDDALSHDTTNALRNILQRLPNLKKFSFHTDGPFPPQLSWALLEEHIQDFLVDVLHRLPEVDMGQIGLIPPKAFDNCATLKKLRMRTLYDSASTTVKGIEQLCLTRPQLEALVLTDITTRALAGQIGRAHV